MTSQSYVRIFVVLILVTVVGNAFGQEETPASLSGFESTELFGVEDNVDMDPNGEMLRRLIFRSRTVSNESLERYSQFSKGVDDELLIKESQEHRFWVFRRKAVVSRIARQQLPDDLATEEFKDYWLLIAKQGEQTYAIVTRTIPTTWRKLESLEEPIEFTGFYFGLKKLPGFVESGQSVPMFVCNRVSWYPERTVEDAIGDSQLYLASQGVDLGYLD